MEVLDFIYFHVIVLYLGIQLAYGARDTSFTNSDDRCRAAVTMDYDIPFNSGRFRTLYVSICSPILSSPLFSFQLYFDILLDFFKFPFVFFLLVFLSNLLPFFCCPSFPMSSPTTFVCFLSFSVFHFISLCRIFYFFVLGTFVFLCPFFYIWFLYFYGWLNGLHPDLSKLQSSALAPEMICSHQIGLMSFLRVFRFLPTVRLQKRRDLCHWRDRSRVLTCRTYISIGE